MCDGRGRKISDAFNTRTRDVFISRALLFNIFSGVCVCVNMTLKKASY